MNDIHVLLLRFQVYADYARMISGLRSHVATSKQPKLGPTQDLFSRINEATTGYTFNPCVWSFTSIDAT